MTDTSMPFLLVLLGDVSTAQREIDWLIEDCEAMR